MSTTSSLMTKNNVLVIDGQVFQNTTFYRGMGRYSFMLLKTYLLKKTSFDRIVLMLNKNIETSEERLSHIKNISNRLDIVWINYPKIDFPINKSIIGDFKFILNNFLSTTFINKKLTFFMLSNFEVFQSLSVFPDLPNCTNILLFYDLIPHLFYKEYLQDTPNYIQEYYSRFINIFSSDQVFTISETTKNDLTSFLNVNQNKVTNINGALIKVKTNHNISKYSNTLKNYFLYPSGNDLRKNNDKAIKAFSKFSLKNNNKYTLVITSNFSNQAVKDLTDIKNSTNPKAKIIFSGNVSDDQLDSLYLNCIAVVFIPSYEGLGLPVLEAIDYNKKIIVSNISVFREISEIALNYCDPENIDSIVSSFENVLKNTEPNIKEYKRIKSKYTWENTVKIFERSLNNIHKVVLKNRFKIALVGPILTGYSAIAKYCEDIYSGFLDHADVDYYFDAGHTIKKFRESYLPFITNYYDIRDLYLEQYKHYDYFIYNLGNSEFHVNIYKKASIFPGILIVHDGSLSGMFKFSFEQNLIDEKRYQLEKNLDYNTNDTRFITSITNSSLLNITHSKYTQHLVHTRKILNVDTIIVNHPISYINLPYKNNKKVVISLAGIIAPEKGTDIFIETIQKIYRKYKDKVSFKIFGYDFANLSGPLEAQLSNFPCEIVSNLSDLAYQTKLKETNILINFRQKYNGETSRSCLEAMKNGVVVVVNDIGWFSELPDNCVIKITNPKNIFKTVSHLIDNPKELAERSQNSWNLIYKEFNTTSYIDTIIESIKNINKTNPNLKTKISLDLKKNNNLNSILKNLVTNTK